MQSRHDHRAPLPRPFILLFLALLLGFGSSAQAARRVALLIGNSQYQHETVLPNPVRDVALLERTLTELGFAVDKAVNLDKRGMELAINRFASKTAGADTALVFYAGHGTQPSKGGRSFLLPVNAQVTDDETLETDGVPAETLLANSYAPVTPPNCAWSFWTPAAPARPAGAPTVAWPHPSPPTTTP